MTFNMHGRNAAIIAEGAYAVAAAKASSSRDVKADADLFAQREAAFNGGSAAKAGTTIPVSPMEAVVSQSGAWVKEEAGFGVLLQRHGGQDREFIFAMRGTVGPMGRSKDWLSNYQIGLTRGPSGALVHAGFMDIYSAMRIDVQRMIARARPNRIHFIGHSLGGALATLAAIDYAQAGGGTPHLYTFGAPRVGSTSLESDVVRLIGAPRIKRVYSISDPVPCIPLFPFKHVGAGSIGFVDNNRAFSGKAHSMLDTYIPQMPTTGWPAENRLSSKSDPAYWLTQAESMMFTGSAWVDFCLAKALKGILYLAANAISAALTVGFTLADALIVARQNVRALEQRAGAMLLRFINAALRYVGMRPVDNVNAHGPLSVLLGVLLEMVMRPLRAAGQAALRAVT